VDLSRVGNVAREVRRVGLVAARRRVVRSVQRYGLRAAFRRTSGVGVPYSWYRLDLTNEPPALPLPEGVVIRLAEPADLPLYRQLADQDLTSQAQRWWADGNQLWLGVSGSEAVFAMWIFPDRFPTGEALDGWLRFPPGVAFMEHGMVAASFRGQGIMPAGTAIMGSSLRAQGMVAAYGKNLDSNNAIHRSNDKVGFVKADPDDPVAADLMRQVGTLR
jgi:hypothetical protein